MIYPSIYIYLIYSIFLTQDPWLPVRWPAQSDALQGQGHCHHPKKIKKTTRLLKQGKTRTMTLSSRPKKINKDDKKNRNEKDKDKEKRIRRRRGTIAKTGQNQGQGQGRCHWSNKINKDRKATTTKTIERQGRCNHSKKVNKDTDRNKCAGKDKDKDAVIIQWR